MALALNESEHHQKRHYMCLTGSEVPQTKSVKRLRGDEHTLSVQQQECFSTSVPKTIKRSSKYRGVSRHKWTGRYEAHLWDKLTWNVTQKKKGKQVYLGAYDDEEAAARAYDLASLKYWGSSTFTNFPMPFPAHLTSQDLQKLKRARDITFSIFTRLMLYLELHMITSISVCLGCVKSNYEKELEVMQITTKEEYLASLRIKSSGLSRGASMYRGATRHHQYRRREAERGSAFGNKYLHLGTYSNQEEPAQAYDIAAIKYVGINAITNFDLSTYMRWFKPGTKKLVSVQETKVRTESKEDSSYNCSGIKMQSSCLTAKPGRMNPMSAKEKYTRNTLLSSCRKSSSPTALGLLLRSSVFKELVKKNSNLSEEESDDENTKNLLQASSNDRCEEISYIIPFSHYSNTHWIELHG